MWSASVSLSLLPARAAGRRGLVVALLSAPPTNPPARPSRLPLSPWPLPAGSTTARPRSNRKASESGGAEAGRRAISADGVLEGRGLSRGQAVAAETSTRTVRVLHCCFYHPPWQLLGWGLGWKDCCCHWLLLDLLAISRKLCSVGVSGVMSPTVSDIRRRKKTGMGRSGPTPSTFHQASWLLARREWHRRTTYCCSRTPLLLNVR